MARSKNVRPRRGPRRQTRAEKSKEFRQVLIDSAAQTVSRHGYADASVSRITQRAKLAQGTFYNYFETRQDILDLLPVAYGEKMLGYIGEQTANADRGADRWSWKQRSTSTMGKCRDRSLANGRRAVCRWEVGSRWQ